MLHLEFPPEFVHVAFTSLPLHGGDIVSDNQHHSGSDSSDASRFAVMGDYGNCVNIYDSTTFFVTHQIHAQVQLKQFSFANANRELLVMTADCRVRAYSLARYEGILLREITAVHRGSITSMSVAANSGYFLTGGEDSMLKVWDYEAQKTAPYYFQAFIGHTYPVRGVMFCPNDNSTIMSVGDKDGIYLWSFYGDVRTQFAHSAIEGEDVYSERQEESKRPKSGSVLEKLRATKKEAKHYQPALGALKEGSFVLPPFRQLQTTPEQNTLSSIGGMDDHGEESSGMQQLALQYHNVRREKGLTFNHFANVPTGNYDVELGGPHRISAGAADTTGCKEMVSSVVNGYDGFGGVHDNLVWCTADGGYMAYTLHNKLIIEGVKTREQTVFCDSATQLSTIAISSDKKLLAVGEGRPSSKTGNSLIYVYDTEQRKLIGRYTFHQRGVQALAFANGGQHLLSVGVQGESNVAVWDLQSGLVVRSCLVKNTGAVNQIKVDPYVFDDYIQFALVGNKGCFNLYRFEVATAQLQAFEVDNVPLDYKNCDFTSVAYTQYLNGVTGCYFAVIGCADGSMTAYDLQNNTFIDEGEKKWVITGEIGHARCNNGTLVIASSSGTVARFNVSLGQMFPTEAKQVQILRADGPVVAISMDDLNNEGLVGTAFGVIYYLNFNEKILIRIVQKVYSVPKPVTTVKFSQANPNLVLTNCTASEGGQNGSSLAKVWAAGSLDQVMKFAGAVEGAGPACFVLTSVNDSRYSLIGHLGGVIRLVNLDSLKVEGSFRLPVTQTAEVDEFLTAGAVNPNGVNVAIGTNMGGIFLGSIKEDAQGRPKVSFGRLDVHGASYVQAVTSIQFSQFDPMGSLLVAYDNGVVKAWQSSVRNDQFLKLMELQPYGGSIPQFDMSECGYQQFDLADCFDMFENPHGLEEVSEAERTQLRLLYSNKKHKHCEARFSPARSSPDLFLAFVSSLQYVYLRNFVQRAIVKRVSLLHFPTCFALVDFNALFLGAAADL